MKIQVNKIPENKTRLIPVAQELLNGVKASEVKEIECKGNVYKVNEYFIQEKEEHHQDTLFYLTYGERIKIEDIFKKYSKSEYIVLFIGDPKKDEVNKAEVIIEEIPDMI